MRRSLSYSKRETLVTFLRRYFYEYYAAAKKVPFDPARKEAVASLKELSGLYLLAGEIGHWFIDQYLKKGESARAWLERTALEKFDRAVNFSRDPHQRERAGPEKYPTPTLLEFHLGDPEAEALS